MITQCWTNGTVTLQYGEIEIWLNIRHIKSYISDMYVEYISIRICMIIVNIGPPDIYFCIILNIGNKAYNWIITGTLENIQIHQKMRRVFNMMMSFSSHCLNPQVTRKSCIKQYM